MTTSITASSHANTAPTELDPITLDRDDVAALRTAEYVSFYRHEGQNYILAYLRGGHSSDPRVFTARERRLFPGTDSYIPDRKRRIDCTGSVYGYPPEDTDGQRAWDHTTNPGVTCYEPGIGGSYTDTWATLAGLLKTGDRLMLKWTADISQALRHNYGLHRDTLHLIVRRGEQRLTFLLADRVTPANSARMIRPHG